MPTRRVPIIGVVGGIASGKTATARAFEALGCRLIEADKVGHEMLGKADVFSELVIEFGREIIGEDQRIDRPALARLAFATDEATQRLNEIVGGALWPEFRRRAMEAADHAGEDMRAVLLDAALLYESETEDLCDAVVFVDAPDEARRERIKDRRNWDWEEVRRRESRQFPLSRKRQLADFVISNHSDLGHLHNEASRILSTVCERFASQSKPPAGTAKSRDESAGSTT
jgi:dephospho-CoA kinase